MTTKRKIALFAGVGLPAIGLGGAAHAAPDAETAYILNTLSFMFHGVLVFWMACGFAMLEAGLVRSKNTTLQLTKNISLFSVAAVMYFLIGYNLMYADVSGWIGSGGVWGPDDAGTLEGAFGGEGGDEGAAHSAASDWFFQMVFVAATASVVSGALAERIKLWPFLIFVATLTGVIYPIQGSWTWGGGWLSEMGFADFAGSTIVHSVGGWAALAGALILGARKGKYGADGSVNPMPGANLPLATLGAFILWMGWFGFNGGSQLSMDSAADVIVIANIYVNTNTAAAGGVLAAMILTQVIYKKVDLTMALNGALAGLVSITAQPDTPSPSLALFIGAVGGVLVVVFVPLLDKLKIDDVVGAIPVHLAAGVWGTVAVTFSNADANLTTQLIGVAAIGAFAFAASAGVFAILKAAMGLRCSVEEEETGLDQAECGMEAYPEFGRGSQMV